MVDMLHYEPIARALRLLCQGATALAADAETGAETLTVGSNCLFSAGDAVLLTDASGAAESHTVAALSGLTQIHLAEPVAAEFTVADQARLQLPAEARPQVRWVSLGRPEALPAPTRLAFPAVIIEPLAMKQPPSAGTNRNYQQEYSFSVYWLERFAEGAEPDMGAIGRAEGLFNLLMSDPYLGGTCYHSQVTAFEPSPPAEAKLRARDLPLRLVRLELLARKSALWG
jgi:hypothetical protein